MAAQPPSRSLEPSPQRRWLVAGALALIGLLAIVLIVALVRGDGSDRPSDTEWADAFGESSVVVIDARVAIDEAAERSRGAASVRCEATLADPAVEEATASITNGPDEAVDELAAEWAASFREGAELCVAGEIDEAVERFDRADELLLLLGERAEVEVDLPGYDRSEAFDDLTSGDFAFTTEQADCILDEVEAQGLQDAIVQDDVDALDPAEVEAVTAIFGECTVGDLFTDRPDETADDTG